MASKRPVASYYGPSTRAVQHPDRYSRVGHSASTEGAVLAAARRLLRGQWRRADVYDGGVHYATLTRTARVVTINIWRK